MSKEKNRKGRPAPEPIDTRTNYGIDRRNFIIAWESSNSAQEATARLAQLSRSLNLPEMPHAIVVARASTLRGEGVKLKKHPRGRKPASIHDENELIRQMRAGKTFELTAGEPAAAPPEEAEPTREELMELWRKFKDKKK